MSSIVIAQGGGPTAVINQTLCGAIMSARRLIHRCGFSAHATAYAASPPAMSSISPLAT